MKILVVDDFAVMRKIIINQLLEMNFQNDEIVQAATGKEAVAAARREEFGLILMDWNMPEMLGIDAVKAIRQMGNKTPILMVTTEGEKSNIIAAIQAGANNYLVKPFNKEDLKGKILTLVGTTPGG